MSYHQSIRNTDRAIHELKDILEDGGMPTSASITIVIRAQEAERAACLKMVNDLQEEVNIKRYYIQQLEKSVSHVKPVDTTFLAIVEHMEQEASNIVKATTKTHSDIITLKGLIQNQG